MVIKFPVSQNKNKSLPPTWLRIPKLSDKPEIFAMYFGLIAGLTVTVLDLVRMTCIHSHSQDGELPDHSPLASQVRVLFPLLRM